MQQKKYWKSKKTEQIPLFGTARIKKSSLTLSEIKKLQQCLYREGFKILSIIIKSSDKKDEMRRDGKQLFF